MLERIYQMKDAVIEQMDKNLSERGGVDHVDIQEFGMMADIVKDLADAEKACMESEYYRSVTEAMNSQYGYSYPMMPNQYSYMGYNGSGNSSGGSNGGGSNSGYGYGSQQGYSGNYGYRSGGRGSANQYGGSRRGYDGGMGYGNMMGFNPYPMMR